ncbi:MAG: hypothetical protein COU72_02670 [Parcubacteria group bacterium CG10_big_fil_rev_8_21_14_0_10_41_35]|nr:MAG: hypothetical protein COU72_02670 [Parcubacteria group bacterium CG10_big_fil_rev_8_21_14_0_10_41_35]
MSRGFKNFLIILAIPFIAYLVFLIYYNTLRVDIQFEIKEQYPEGQDEPTTYLWVETTSEYPCYNYRLTHTTETLQNETSITFNRPQRPENICLTAIGPATFREQIPLQDGKNILKFKWGIKKDRYTINVLQDKILLKPSLIDKLIRFTKPKDTIVPLVPKNVLWAKCFKYSNDFDWHCNDFFDEIDKIATPYLIPEGKKIPQMRVYTYNGKNEPLLQIIKKYDVPNYYVRIDTKGKAIICLYTERICDIYPESYARPLETTYVDHYD